MNQRFDLSSIFNTPASSLLPSNNSESNSLQHEREVAKSTLMTHQPITNPHKTLLNRNINNCPSDLTGGKRNRWLNNGLKAQNNQDLLSTLPHFEEPTHLYESPIHIHYRTPESLIFGLLYKLSSVRTYMIDTESDRPTRQHPHSLPALIQIQAIHMKNYSTLLLIETQHLPHNSTSLFQSIKQLLKMIFSSSNQIIAWGDVINELRAFSQFELFDISDITNTLNLQQIFTTHWNLTHPHTDECISRHKPKIAESVTDDVLICLINSDDLDDDYDDDQPMNDFTTCICPDDIRPYKTKNSIWSLQKAIQFTFHQALDKSITFNFWSCGLDLNLRTWHSASDKDNRMNLIKYAIHDLFAPTKLFYHIQRTSTSSTIINNTLKLNSIQSIAPSNMKSFLIVTDSHGKYLPPFTTLNNHTLQIEYISGLQWFNPYNYCLCCKSLLNSAKFSSLLASSDGILFVVGSNSIRTTTASIILNQVEEIIDHIHSKYSNLNSNRSITIATVFPCLKISTQFPTHASLTNNIQKYNEGLQLISIHKRFSIINFPITEEHLSADGLHVDIAHLSIIYDNIRKYVNDLFQEPTNRTHTKNRSRDAIKRRNKRRHDKLKIKQTNYTLIRSIARVWKLNDLKRYLKYKNIRYTRLPEIYNHKLRIQFNNSTDLQYAEQHLTATEFNEISYENWLSIKQV